MESHHRGNPFHIIAVAFGIGDPAEAINRTAEEAAGKSHSQGSRRIVKYDVGFNCDPSAAFINFLSVAPFSVTTILDFKLVEISGGTLIFNQLDEIVARELKAKPNIPVGVGVRGRLFAVDFFKYRNTSLVDCPAPL